jgi:hypothetical protein
LEGCVIWGTVGKAPIGTTRRDQRLTRSKYGRMEAIHASRRCGKSVTLPDNLGAGEKKSQSRRNHSKNWMLEGRAFGLGGI